MSDLGAKNCVLPAASHARFSCENSALSRRLIRAVTLIPIAMALAACPSADETSGAPDALATPEPASAGPAAQVVDCTGASPDASCAKGVSPYFQDEVDAVDPSKHLSYVLDSAYGQFDWSYQGLTVKCGTPLACEYGASELLQAMGYRWYTPNPEFYVRPKTIPTVLSAPRSKYWIPNNSMFLVYGHSWDGSNLASRKLLNDRQDKWARLNGVSESAYPAGHRWAGIISDPTSAVFFQAHPNMLRPLGTVKTFNLAGIRGTPDWDLLVEYCAAFLLKAGLNPYNRTNFDPVDSDNNPSDLVYPFSRDVLLKMRAGTSAIGPFPAQAGVPTAEIGVYAYAGHRLPPTQSYAPVYADVALAYNNTSLTYDQLFAQHGALASSIGMREYLDTQAWSDGKPLINLRAKEGYVDRYDRLVAAGVRYSTTETTGNWLVNLIITQQFIRKIKTGKTVPQSVIIDEIVNSVFSGDPAVRDLYVYWGDPANTYSKKGLAKSFEIVSSMRDGWYKEHFKKLMVILFEFEMLPKQQPELGSNDPFPAAISSLLSKVTAVRDYDITHSYAWVRRQGNGVLNTNYPQLKFNAKPEPAWWSSPSEPTDADYAADASAIAVHAADAK